MQSLNKHGKIVLIPWRRLDQCYGAGGTSVFPTELNPFASMASNLTQKCTQAFLSICWRSIKNYYMTLRIAKSKKKKIKREAGRGIGPEALKEEAQRMSRLP